MNLLKTSSIILLSSLFLTGCGTPEKKTLTQIEQQSSKKETTQQSTNGRSSAKKTKLIMPEAESSSSTASPSGTTESKDLSAEIAKLQTTVDHYTGQAATKEQALAAYYTIVKHQYSTEELTNWLEENDIAKKLFVTDVSRQNVMGGYNQEITTVFPKNTYTISASPLARGSVTFQLINDDQIRVFEVPSHFQWDVNDTEFSFKIVKGYMTHPEIVTLDHPDEELLNLMLENLDENSY